MPRGRASLPKNAVLVLNADGKPVLNADGLPRRMPIASVEDAVAYVNRFRNLPVGPTKGYDQFWNKDGYTNPQSIQKLDAGGILRHMLILHDVAAQKMSEGSAEVATEYQKALEIASGFAVQAQANIQTRKRISRLLSQYRDGDAEEKAFAKSQLAKLREDADAEIAPKAAPVPAPATQTEAAPAQSATAETAETDETAETAETAETELNELADEPELADEKQDPKHLSKKERKRLERQRQNA